LSAPLLQLRDAVAERARIDAHTANMLRNAVRASLDVSPSAADTSLLVRACIVVGAHFVA
jgi:hypothetical protein